MIPARAVRVGDLLRTKSGLLYVSGRIRTITGEVIFVLENGHQTAPTPLSRPMPVEEGQDLDSRSIEPEDGDEDFSWDEDDFSWDEVEDDEDDEIDWG